MENAVTFAATVCSSRFGQSTAFGSTTYKYPDAVVWAEAEDVFEVKMMGQIVGNSERILDEFNEPVKRGIFINNGDAMDAGGGEDKIMEAGFVGKIISATRVKDRDALGPAEFTLIVKRLAPIENVSLPPPGLLATRNGALCAAPWGSRTTRSQGTRCTGSPRTR
jgi:hypothetical protein